jgi:hypothetical protein
MDLHGRRQGNGNLRLMRPQEHLDPERPFLEKREIAWLDVLVIDQYVIDPHAPSPFDVSIR